VWLPSVPVLIGLAAYLAGRHISLTPTEVTWFVLAAMGLVVAGIVKSQWRAGHDLANEQRPTGIDEAVAFQGMLAGFSLAVLLVLP
jgi:hypothetical protein